MVRMRSAVRICPAAPKKQIPIRVSAFLRAGQIRIMSAGHIGGLHRPVQTLVDTSILFSRPPQGKTECKRILPSSSGPHPYQGCAVIRSRLLIDTLPLSFACPKESGKENDTREGKISISPPPWTLPHSNDQKGLASPFWNSPEILCAHERSVYSP